MRTFPASEATRAWVAFADPFVGGMSALLLYMVGVKSDSSLLISASEIGFLINLFQLLPAKPSDGGFIVGSISKQRRSENYWRFRKSTIQKTSLRAKASRAQVMYDTKAAQEVRAVLDAVAQPRENEM